jgi:uncharacterized membrane protein YfcA
MNAWWSLFKKEFRLMRFYLLINGWLLIVGGMVGIFTAYKHHSGIPSLILFIALIWHTIYLLVYVLKSLGAEKRHTPIWLQSPQSAWILISAKFTAGVVLLCTSLSVNLFLWIWLVQVEFHTGSFQGPPGFEFMPALVETLKQHPGILALITIQRSLLLGALGFMIYFIVEIFKYSLRGWRWILFPLLLILSFQLFFRLGDTSLYGAMMHWGKLNLPEINASSHYANAPEHFFWGPLYWGDIVYRFLLTYICLYAAAWLLDRKVEV